MAELTNIKQGEQKNLILTVKDAAGQLVNLTGATLFLGFKSKKTDTSYVFSKEDASFNKARVTEGIVTVLLSSTDTAHAGKFVGELKVTFQDSTVEKSVDFFLYIEQAVTA